MAEKGVMGKNEIEKHLKKSLLMGGLPENEIRRLSEITRIKKFGKGETVFSEGQESHGFYLLVSGIIKIYKISPSGKEQILRLVRNGGLFGEAATFIGNRYPAYAGSLSESEVLFFPSREFRLEVLKNPEFALHMLGAMSMNLQHLVGMVERLTLRDVRARLAEFLLNIPVDKNNEARLDVTKRELALHLSTQPETLSRVLGSLQAEGAIEVNGKKIRFLDIGMMEKIASGLTF